MPSNAQMHALGCMTYNWNFCERLMSDLFGTLTKLSPRIRYTVLQGMGDVTMVEKLRAMPKKLRLGTARAEAIIHACDLYDINRQNRNALVHATWVPKGRSGHFASLHKKTGSLLMVAEDAETIRRSVEEVGVCAQFILDLLSVIVGYNPHPGSRQSLPEKPPLPERIVKSPPLVAPKRQRPLQPSRG